MTLYKDMKYHPAFTNKPVRLDLTDDRRVKIITDSPESYFTVSMTTDEASLLHYLLTELLFDVAVTEQFNKGE